MARPVGVAQAGSITHFIVAVGADAVIVSHRLQSVQCVVGVSDGLTFTIGKRCDQLGFIAYRIVLIGQTTAIGFRL